MTWKNLFLKMYTTLGYIVSLILLSVVYIFKFKMFHQEALVETIKLIGKTSIDDWLLQCIKSMFW